MFLQENKDKKFKEGDVDLRKIFKVKKVALRRLKKAENKEIVKEVETCKIIYDTMVQLFAKVSDLIMVLFAAIFRSNMHHFLFVSVLFVRSHWNNLQCFVERWHLFIIKPQKVPQHTRLKIRLDKIFRMKYKNIIWWIGGGATVLTD